MVERFTVLRLGQVFTDGLEGIGNRLDCGSIGAIGGTVVNYEKEGDVIVLLYVLLGQREQVFLIERNQIPVILSPDIQQSVLAVEADLDVVLLGRSHKFNDILPHLRRIQAPLDHHIRLAFSSVDAEKIEDLIDTVYTAASKLV